MESYGFVLYPFIGILLAVGVSLLLDRADRRRIVQHIQDNGGKPIEILRAWGKGTRNERAYEVSFINSTGTRITAICRSSMSGVYWISKQPPDHDDDDSTVV